MSAVLIRVAKPTRFISAAIYYSADCDSVNMRELAYVYLLALQSVSNVGDGQRASMGFAINPDINMKKMVITCEKGIAKLGISRSGRSQYAD